MLCLAKTVVSRQCGSDQWNSCYSVSMKLKAESWHSVVMLEHSGSCSGFSGSHVVQGSNASSGIVILQTEGQLRSSFGAQVSVVVGSQKYLEWCILGSEGSDLVGMEEKHRRADTIRVIACNHNLVRPGEERLHMIYNGQGCQILIQGLARVCLPL